MTSWIKQDLKTLIAPAFDALVRPHAWNLIEISGDEGRIIWGRPFIDNFAVELHLNVGSSDKEGCRFQTQLCLVSEGIAKLELAAGFEIFDPDHKYVPPYRNAVIGIYIEGLRRLLHGGAMRFVEWRRASGLINSHLWSEMIEDSMKIISIDSGNPTDLAAHFLNLDKLASRASPTPITFFVAPYLLAAETLIIFNDYRGAHYLLAHGKSENWIQLSGPRIKLADDIRAKKIQRLSSFISTRLLH